jgi:hypothetical protein
VPRSFLSPRKALAAACALVAVSGFCRSGLADEDDARRYFQNGVDLITSKQPNYQDAFYQFQLAYRESGNNWKVLGNLGLCALKLERDQDAVLYYEDYLSKGGAEIVQEERSAIERDLLLLKGNLATVVLTSQSPEVKLFDRREGSSAPPQPYTMVDGKLELQLRAGSHTITARVANRQLAWEIVLEPKAVVTHEFDFDEKAAGSEPQRPDGSGPSKPGTQDGTDLRLPGYLLLGAGGVGLALGGFFAWQHFDYDGQADDAYACNQTQRCSVDDVKKVRGLEDSAGSAGLRAIIATSVGGAALATGTVLLLLSSHGSADDRSQARLTPWIGYRTVGVSGRF